MILQRTSSHTFAVFAFEGFIQEKYSIDIQQNKELTGYSNIFMRLDCWGRSCCSRRPMYCSLLTVDTSTVCSSTEDTSTVYRLVHAALAAQTALSQEVFPHTRLSSSVRSTGTGSTPSAPASAGGTDRDLAWTQLAQKLGI
jgi:hypothetical protein